MIEISYLNAAKQECHISFEDYNEFVEQGNFYKLRILLVN